MDKHAHQTRTHHLAAALVICLVGVIIYSNALNGDFVFDDLHNITNNPYLRIKGFNVTGLAAAGFKGPHATRPVAYISFALNYYFHGYRVSGYHIVNILIHLVNGILVYVLVRITLVQSSFLQGPNASGPPHASITLPSLFAALLFVAHPIQVQSVTYIVQRMNSMAAMFYLLALVFYIYGKLSRSGSRRWAFWAGLAAAWVLALGCKEIAATLPVVILLYEWYFFQDLDRERFGRLVTYLPVLAVLLYVIAIVYLGENPVAKILKSCDNRDFTTGERVLTQFRVLVFYLSLLFFPHPSRLNLLHYITVSHSLIDPPSTLLALLFLALLLGVAVRVAKKERLLSFCILWFFIHMVIESSVFGLELIFEHRLYLPLFGLCLAAAGLLSRVPRARRSVAYLAAVSVIIALGTATYLRNKTWRDTITLWSDVISKNPHSERAHYNLGSDLARLGRLEEAVHHLSEALRIKPEYAKAHNNLGLTLFRQGRFDEAVYHYSEALRILPGNAAAHYNLGLALVEKGRGRDAAGHYAEALRIKPDFAEAHNSLGVLLNAQGSDAAATHHFSEALRINPDLADAHLNMGSADEKQGKFKAAVEHYLTALKIRPDDANAYNNLGVALTRLGLLEDAVRCYSEALRIRPDDAAAHNNLGVVLARQGRPEAAVRHYTESLRIRPGYGEAHNNLGIALMQDGSFEAAVSHFTQALRIQPGDPGILRNLELSLQRMKKSGGER